MQRIVVALFLAFGVVCAPGLSAAQSRNDDQLAERVRRALAQDGLQSVNVRADDGLVVLSGVVHSAREKILAIEAAFSVADVEALDTELRLRFAVTPEVEEEIWFTLFQEGLDSGIDQVIVDNGIASLSGQVVDEATRDRVHSIARHAQGVTAVTSTIVIKSVTLAKQEPAAPPPEPELEPEPVPEPEPEPEFVPEPVPAPEAEPEPEPVPEPEAEPEPEPVPAPEPKPEAVPEPEPTTSSKEELDLPQPLPRADLPQDIAYQILTSSDYTVFDHVEFSLEGSEVILQGSVTSATKKENLESAVANVPGVQGVQNELHVLSDSSENRRLRERLFRRIYEDPSFAEFVDLPNPPIHIVVESKHVTLTGAVGTLILRMSAEAIVRTTFGVRTVRNEIRVRE